MSVAHHSNYLAWFEVGRTDLCREAGISYREIEAGGWVLVVTEATCKYRRPFLYDDEVVIRTFVEFAGNRSIRFRYELFDAAVTTLHADGTTSHFWLDRTSRKPVTADAEIVGLFAPFVGC